MAPRPPLTHFLCLPLSCGLRRSSLVAAFDYLRAAILLETNPSDATTITSAIRPIGTLHVTLGVMRLADDSSLRAAKDLLQSLDLKSLLRMTTPDSDISLFQASSMHIKLGNISAMGDPRATSVLYLTPIDESNRLRPFCVAVRDAFRDAGLLTNDNRELKLHVTVVNTIYASGRFSHRGGGRSRLKRPHTFDASQVLQNLSHHVWMENLDVSKLSICRMGAVKILSEDGQSVHDERYEEIASRALHFAQ